MSTEKHTNITVRVPVAVVDALRELARAESERTGLRVDLSSIVRRALTRDLATAKGADK